MSQNIFDKYYLGGSHSKETPKSSNQKNSSNEVVTTATFVNYNLSNEFANMFTYYIVPYLSISDVINLKLCNKTLNILVGHKAIKFAIIANAAKGKFSEEKRFKLWKHYLQLKFFKGDLYESYSDFKPKNKKEKKRELFYKFILNQGEKIKKGEKVEEYTDEKIKQIKVSFDYLKKDIDRTFYTKRFTEGEGKKELKRVLEGISVIKDNVGYCQGMNFIAGSMIHLLNSESKAFMVFNCILKEYELKNLFAYNTPDYGIRVYQLNHYVKKYLPNIYYHFKKNNLSFDLIYSRWLMTLFSGYLDMNYLDFPWMCFFIDKWKGLLKVSLILLDDLKDQLMKCDLEGLSLLIKDNFMQYHTNLNKSFRLYASQFKIKNSELDQLRNEYYIELANEKINLVEIEKWDIDQRGALNEYLTQKQKIDALVKKDVANYKHLMEEIDKKSLIALRHYNEQMRQVLMMKNKIDKIAEEKFSYEEMYKIYKQKIDSLTTESNLNQLKSDTNVKSKRKNSDCSKVREIVEKEMNKIIEKYNPIVVVFEKESAALYKKYDIVDKNKIELENLEKEKNKRKMQLEQYLFFNEQKNKELLKDLTDKLKLSDNFKKTNKF